MEYPKMIYRSALKHADQKAVEVALHSRDIEMLIVHDVEAEASAVSNGFTADLGSLISRPKRSRPQTESDGE